MEQWDLYTVDRGRTGKVMNKNEPVPAGMYHMQVHVVVFNRAGQMLIQQRTESKQWFPGLWDYSVGGRAQAGETSAQAAEREVQEEIGLTVGADVPFCIRGGLQRAQGVGERLTPIAMKRPLYIVAFQPCRGLSTKEVFTALHEDGIRDEDRPDNEAAQRALQNGDVRLLGRSLGNVLEPVSRRLRPDIDKAIREIEAAGAVGARMTGSGSAVFGVFLHAGACRKAAQELQKTYPACRMMRTAECGVVIAEDA